MVKFVGFGVFIVIVLICLVIIAGVAFFTLLERKFLGYFQLRVGPNKVGLGGLLQPVADAMKLFLKEFVVPNVVNNIIFLFGPRFILLVCVGVWVLYPVGYPRLHFFWGFLFFVCLSSVGVFGVIMVGWSSNSKYAYLGCVRAAAQFISYEVIMLLIVLGLVFVGGNFNLGNFYELGIWGLGFLFPLFLIWLICILAETNRAPFDFVEGESELVSGFNVEYGGVGFSIIFIAEYRMILFMGVLTRSVFLGGISGGVFFSCLIRFLVVSFVVLCRGGLPRYRYDLLMGLTWKFMLPVVLGYLFLISIIIG